MKKLFVMVGIPGSGKGTYIKGHKADNSFVISSDDIRKEIFGDENSQEDNGKVFNVFYGRMVKAITEFPCDEIWLDATNINRKNRRRIFEELKQKHVRDLVEVTAVVMATPYETCVKRDLERDRTVGEEVIRKFVARFCYPQTFEGFDHITAIWTDEKKENVIWGIEDKMTGFDQKSKWHRYDLMTHTEKTFQALKNESATLKVAAIFHDVGKLWTQTVGEDGYCHYYTHERVSSYFTLAHWREIQAELNRCLVGYGERMDDVLFLIDEHILGHNVQNVDKYVAMFGKDMWDMLMKFCDADKKAH